jgi:adenylate cyclase class 2
VAVLEQEMKIPVSSLGPVRRRLVDRGAVLVHSLALEDNWVLDDAARSLSATGRLLRLRRFGGRATLTLKGEARFSGGVKSRVEVETEIGNAEHGLGILAGLGFAPVRRYQKRRESYSLDRVIVALDETPMGAFVELEGQAEQLPAAAFALDLDPQAAAAGTYLDLWNAYRTAHPGAPEDMLFAL